MFWGRVLARQIFGKLARSRPRAATAFVCAILALSISSPPAQAFSGFQNTLRGAGLYPDLPATVSGNACYACHVNAPTNTTRTSFGAAVQSAYDANGDMLGPAIQTAAESSYVPHVLPGQSFKISASTTANLPINYDPGQSTGGSAYAKSQLQAFILSGDGGDFTVDSSGSSANGNLVPGSGLTEGNSYSITIRPQNPIGFRPITAGSNLPVISVTVNRAPAVSNIVDNSDPDDNLGNFQANLLSSASDGDGDTLSLVTSSVTLSSVRDENGTLDTTYNALAFTTSTSGTLQFDTQQFDPLDVGESRTLVFDFTVTDGTDTASATYTVTVIGIREGGNALPVVSARTFNITEDSTIPATTDLTQDDSGTTFPDADNDPLSVVGGSLTLTGGASPTLPVTLSGNDLQVTSLAAFQFLSQGQTRSYNYTYQISDTQGTTANTVNVVVTGQNDPLSASGFSTTVNESLLVSQINLLTLSGANDPDTGDTLIFQNLRNVTSSPALRDPAKAQLVSVGGSDVVFFEFAPEFTRDLSAGETIPLTFDVDVSDQQGSTQTISVTVNVDGVDSSGHAASGIYADSLTALYPLASFQAAASRPAACLTCHTTTTNLDRPKPNCNAPADFTVYGAAVCNDNRGGPISQRLTNRDTQYAPRITEANIRRFISETATAGTPVGAPVGHTPGLKVDGTAATIDSFFVENDLNGSFSVLPSGQVRLNRPVSEGLYVLNIMPLNRAGSKDASGNERAVPGFYPLDSSHPQNAFLTRVEIVVSTAPPVAVADSANINTGAPSTINVTGNDSGGAAASLTITTPPANGGVTVAADLSIVYTPNAGFTGTDSFSYEATNGSGTSSPATVTLNVVGVGALLANDDTASASSGQTISIDVLGNDGNVSAASVVSIATAPDPTTGGTVAVSGQSITFTPAAAASGDVSFTYTGSNPGAGGSTATVTVSVTPFGAGVLSSGVTDPQLVKVARAMEQSCAAVAGSGASGADATAFLAACQGLSAAAGSSQDITAALQAIRNEEHLASVDAAASVARGLGRSMGQRLARLRDGGGGGVDVSGIALSFAGNQLPGAALQDLLDKAAGAAPAKAFGGGGGWGGFVSGEIAVGNSSGGDNGEDSDLVIASLMAGIDYRINTRAAIGFGIGFSQSTTDFSGGGELKANGFQLSTYGVLSDVFREGVTLEGHASIGQLSFDSDRRIRFNSGGLSVDSNANAEFDGLYVNIAPRLSYEVGGRSAAGLRTLGSFTWYVGLDYLMLQLDDYTESGGAGLALAVQGETYHSLVARAGAEARYPVLYGSLVQIDGFGGLGLAGELLDGSRSVTSSFAVAGPGAPTFTVTEDGDRSLAAEILLGTTVRFNGGSVDLSYNGEVDLEDGDALHRFSVGYATPVFGNDLLRLGVNSSAASRNDTEWDARLDYNLKF